MSVPTALLDHLELSYLSGLQDQRSVLARTRKLMAGGMGLFSGSNSAPTAADEEDLGIKNRSPNIRKIYTTSQKSDGPWVALIALILILALFGLLMWWSAFGPKPTPAPVQPAPPATGVQAPNFNWDARPF